MNSCWNAWSLEASQTYNAWIDMRGASHDNASAEAPGHPDECTEAREGPY